MCLTPSVRLKVELMKKITIIGGGATGTLLAVNLIKGANEKPLEINLIEREKSRGRGVAYSAIEDFHLLNVPAAKMGAFPDDLEHFHRWLAEKNYDFAPNDFVPRRIYGEYLRELLNQTVESKPASVSFNVFDDEAVDISISENGAKVILNSGETVSSDKVILAFGNFAPPHPRSENNEFINHEKYFQNPWNNQTFNRLKPTDDVFVIGTGLTAVDAILSLHHKNHAGKIYAFSTRGLFPAVHRLGFSYPSFYDELKQKTRITDLLKIVRAHIERAHAENNDWRSVIDSLRPHTQTLWLDLPVAEKRYFMQHLSRYWNAARHRMPPEAARILDEMKAENRLRILKGRLKNIQADEAGKLKISYSLNAERISVSTDAVINCIGSENKFDRIESALVKNLINKKIIKNDRLNLGIDATPDGKIIDGNGAASETILTVGTALKGILWESTAMPEIRQQTKNLALTLLN